ncbi:hypothetical protein [Aliikangiella maris]|uniref:Uncharacterized protein n=2 Tax=Aliikangiella maris TaxID=3162458 RepID=A0ABV2BPU1_9GAMM
MLSKFKIVYFFSLFVIFFSFSTTALEPLKENRARIFSLKATLLLPDYNFLDVDMSFDCGGHYENTAMIVSSLAGAQLLAAAYTHLWGEEAGEMVMKTWQNKVNIDDPRLPTFLIVTPMGGSNFDWKGSVNITNNIENLQKKSTLSTKYTSTNNVMPTMFGGCGTRGHPGSSQ